MSRNFDALWCSQLFMKTKLQTLLCLLSVVALMGCATAPRHSTAWEYKIVQGQLVVGLQDQINKAAAEGWLFVSTANQTDNWGYAVMKRAKK